MPRPRAHELALTVARPLERLVLQAVANWQRCDPDELPTELHAGLSSAVMVGLRPILDEMAKLMEPGLFVAPLADALEPEKRPESVELQPVPISQRPTAPPVAGWDDDAVTPLEEPGYELTGDIRRLLQPLDRRPTRQVADPLAQVPPGKTIRSSPPPVPNVLPDVKAAQLRNQRPKR